MGRYLDRFNRRIELTDSAHYHREQYQSFMTASEWRNVEMAREYAQFIAEGNSLLRYPYFRQIADLWKITWNSYFVARRYNGTGQILSSEYSVMSIFVSFFTSLELLPKALFSLIISPFLPKENKTEMQRHLANFYKDYANQLETVPFYNHNYTTIRTQLAEKYQEVEEKTWVIGLAGALFRQNCGLRTAVKAIAILV